MRPNTAHANGTHGKTFFVAITAVCMYRMRGWLGFTMSDPRWAGLTTVQEAYCATMANTPVSNGSTAMAAAVTGSHRSDSNGIVFLNCQNNVPGMK